MCCLCGCGVNAGVVVVIAGIVVVVIAGVLASGCGRGMLVHPYVVSAVNSRVYISARSSSLIGVVFFRLMSELKHHRTKNRNKTTIHYIRLQQYEHQKMH